jgi:hypothetical protein
MVELLLHWLASLAKSRRRLEAENLVLRHQVNVLRRRASQRLRLCNPDRLTFVWLYRICPAIADAVTIIRPETVIRWHRQGFRAFWRWKSRSGGGRPSIPQESRDLIREMSRVNWLWVRPGSTASCSSSVSRSPNRLSPSTRSDAPGDPARAGRPFCTTTRQGLLLRIYSSCRRLVSSCFTVWCSLCTAEGSSFTIP